MNLKNRMECGVNLKPSRSATRVRYPPRHPNQVPNITEVVNKLKFVSTDFQTKKPQLGEVLDYRLLTLILYPSLTQGPPNLNLIDYVCCSSQFY